MVRLVLFEEAAHRLSGACRRRTNRPCMMEDVRWCPRCSRPHGRGLRKAGRQALYDERCALLLARAVQALHPLCIARPSVLWVGNCYSRGLFRHDSWGPAAAQGCAGWHHARRDVVCKPLAHHASGDVVCPPSAHHARGNVVLLVHAKEAAGGCRRGARGHCCRGECSTVLTYTKQALDRVRALHGAVHDSVTRGAVTRGAATCGAVRMHDGLLWGGVPAEGGVEDPPYANAAPLCKWQALCPAKYECRHQQHAGWCHCNRLWQMARVPGKFDAERCGLPHAGRGMSFQGGHRGVLSWCMAAMLWY